MEYWTDQDIEEARANGIKYKTFYKRVYDYGWTVQKAKTVKTRRGQYGEWPDKAVQNGISKPIFYARMSKGWNVYKAATQPPKGIWRKGEIG